MAKVVSTASFVSSPHVGEAAGVIRRKTPITSILRNMRVGEEQSFPIDMMGSVRAVASRLRYELANVGCLYKVKPNCEARLVYVKRVE